MLASYSYYDTWSMIIFISLAMAFKSADYPGVRSNAYDLTVVHSEKLITVTNAAAILAGAIVPIVVGFVVPNVSKNKRLKRRT